MAARWVGLWVLFLAMVTVVEMEGMWGVALELKSETLMEEEMGVSKELPYRIIFSELVYFVLARVCWILDCCSVQVGRERPGLP